MHIAPQGSAQDLIIKMVATCGLHVSPLASFYATSNPHFPLEPFGNLTNSLHPLLEGRAGKKCECKGPKI